jgi:hypothetical protein
MNVSKMEYFVKKLHNHHSLHVSRQTNHERSLIVNELECMIFEPKNKNNTYFEIDVIDAVIAIVTHVFDDNYYIWDQGKLSEKNKFGDLVTIDHDLQIDLLKCLNSNCNLAKFSYNIYIPSEYECSETAINYKFCFLARVIKKELHNYNLYYGGYISIALIAFMQGPRALKLLETMLAMSIITAKNHVEKIVIIDLITQQSLKEKEIDPRLNLVLYTMNTLPMVHNITYAIRNNHIKIVETMMKKNKHYVDIVYVGQLVFEAMRFSTKKRESMVLAILDFYDARICEYRDIKTGSTVLHMAANMGLVKVVKRILQMIRDKRQMMEQFAPLPINNQRCLREFQYVTYHNEYYETPLMLACQNGNLEIVTKFLEFVSDSCITNKELVQAIDVAISYKKERVTKAILGVFLARRIFKRWRKKTMERLLASTVQGSRLPRDIIIMIVGNVLLE